MAYIFDTRNFECQRYLAEWENGINEPNYSPSLKSWQFVFTNGEKCDGLESVFIATWVCDENAKTPEVISSAEIEPCITEMIINSTLACN